MSTQKESEGKKLYTFWKSENGNISTYVTATAVTGTAFERRDFEDSDSVRIAWIRPSDVEILLI